MKGGLNVDHTQEFFSFLSFCTGYGGIEIGVERSLTPIPLKALALLEVEAFAVANLVAKMEAGLLDPAPVWTDIKTFHAYAFRDLVDFLMAGYPCQPFSTAGKRKGKEDPRHLWPWIKDSIKAFRPVVCFFENVRGHISLGLREVLADLAALGYRVDNDAEEPTVGIFSAEECGAPHRRERLFILAYRERSERWPLIRETIKQNWENRGWEKTPGWVRACCPQLADTDCPGGSLRRDTPGMGRLPQPCKVMANAGGKRSSSPEHKAIQREGRRMQGGTTEQFCGPLWVSRPGEPQHWWEAPRLLANPKDADRGTGEKTDKAGPGQRWNRSTDEGGRNMDHSDHGRCELTQGEIRPGRNGIIHPGKGPSECGLGGTVNESHRRVDPAANRVDRLRLCGNGVYPDTAEKAFYTLMSKVINPNPAYVAPSVQLDLFAETA